MDYKAVPLQNTVIEDEEGVVTAFVAVTGIKDNVNDIIEPGAFMKSLATRRPKGVWHHDITSSVSRTEEVKELMPGDRDLPKELANGDPWPNHAGGLLVKTRFNLNTQRGRDAYEDVKFFGTDQEWSIGYNVPTGGATLDKKTGVRRIQHLELFEYSPVLFGAMPNARTVSVKSAQFGWKRLSDEDVLEIKTIISGRTDITVAELLADIETKAEPGTGRERVVRTEEGSVRYKREIGEKIGEAPDKEATEATRKKKAKKGGSGGSGTDTEANTGQSTAGLKRLKRLKGASDEVTSKTKTRKSGTSNYLEEDEVPDSGAEGGKLVDFESGIAMYDDGTWTDGHRWYRIKAGAATKEDIEIMRIKSDKRDEDEKEKEEVEVDEEYTDPDEEDDEDSEDDEDDEEDDEVSGGTKSIGLTPEGLAYVDAAATALSNLRDYYVKQLQQELTETKEDQSLAVLVQDAGLDDEIIELAEKFDEAVRNYDSKQMDIVGEEILDIAEGAAGDPDADVGALKSVAGYIASALQQIDAEEPSEEKDAGLVAEHKDYDISYQIKRGFSAEAREESAKQGHALPDGSFPIETESDLVNAVKAFGRAKDKTAAKAHIIKRAKALGKTDLLPDDWKTADIVETKSGVVNFNPADFLSMLDH